MAEPDFPDKYKELVKAGIISEQQACMLGKIEQLHNYNLWGCRR